MEAKKEKEMKSFAERLKFLIKNSEYKKVKTFAEKTGLNHKSIYNLLGKESNPSYEVIIACLNAFPDVDVHWLLTGRKSDKTDETDVLKQEIALLRNKLDKAVKLYSNRKSPQMSFAFK